MVWLHFSTPSQSADSVCKAAVRLIEAQKVVYLAGMTAPLQQGITYNQTTTKLAFHSNETS